MTIQPSQPFQPPHPHGLTTSPRSWTDAFPVSDRDADALDAWLDNSSASVRAGDAPSPADDHHSLDQNGQTAAAGEDTTFPLTAAARHIHARLETAQRIGVPDVPEDAIWEKIMSSHLALDHAPATRPASIRKRRQATTATTASPRPVRKIAGSHPAISIVLFAALLIAIVAGFRGMNENGAEPIPTAPTGGESHLAAITNATPDVSGTAQASDCVVNILTEEEAAKIVNEWQTAPEADLVPIQGPASAQDADAASNTYVHFLPCSAPKNAPSFLVTTSLSTDRRLFEQNQARHIDTYVEVLKQNLVKSREISAALGQHYTSFVANADDPAVKPHIARTSYGAEYAVLPQDFVVLADGRIGAPVRAVIPGGEVATTPMLMIAQGADLFLIFANVNGQWLFDESVALCTTNCDQFFAKQQAEIDRFDQQPTRAQHPGTATAIITPTVMTGGDNLRMGTATAAVTPATSNELKAKDARGS